MGARRYFCNFQVYTGKVGDHQLVHISDKATSEPYEMGSYVVDHNAPQCLCMCTYGQALIFMGGKFCDC